MRFVLMFIILVVSVNRILFVDQDTVEKYHSWLNKGSNETKHCSLCSCNQPTVKEALNYLPGKSQSKWHIYSPNKCFIQVL